MIVGSLEGEEDNRWFLLVDGVSNQTGSGTRVILEGPNRVLIEVLLVGIRLAKELEVKTLTTKSDLKLVNGEYQGRDPQLMKYLERATRMAATFEKFTPHHVPKE
ncbi:hypothetical protein CR513_43566, partial [Mucuna pruriens]